MRLTTGAMAAVCVLAACGTRREPAAEQSTAPGFLAEVLGDARTLPPGAAIEDYVGAAACADCHADIYAAWKGSPHGRAMAYPDDGNVLGRFDGKPVDHNGGEVVPLRHGDGWAMELRTAAGTERLDVDLILASGRQQQVYFTRDDRGTWVLLPIFWASAAKTWVSTALYQGASLEPGHRGYWRNSALERMDCWACHLSQRHRVIDEKGPRFEFVDTSINCESCHGPGREHVARRKAGDTTSAAFPDLKALDKVAEGRVCGTCHGAQQFIQLPPADDGWPEPFIQTLANPGLRVDGTQRITTYQYSGHRLSRCYLDGAMVCSSCHDPHHQDARNLIGESAEGEHADKQCTVCHRDQLDPAVARAHSRHTAKVGCVDCHMAFSWIGDDPSRHQKTSDHSIMIPRPAETQAVGTPNACNTCHTDKDVAWAARAVVRFGWDEAAVARPWLSVLDRGRKRAPGVAKELAALAADDATDGYLRSSALELLAQQPADPALASVIEPYARHRDAHVRQTAIAALITHDGTDALRWRKAGAADPHPFVRMKTFELGGEPKSYALATLEQQARDAMRYYARPIKPLLDLARMHAARGELARAASLAREVEAMATPDERKHLAVTSTATYLQRRLELEGKGP